MIMQYIERKREILVEKLNNAFGGVYINFKWMRDTLIIV